MQPKSMKGMSRRDKGQKAAGKEGFCNELWLNLQSKYLEWRSDSWTNHAAGAISIEQQAITPIIAERSHGTHLRNMRLTHETCMMFKNAV